MAKLIINGGRPLRGTVKIGGAKNAVLPIMAATVLANDIFTINNVPKISDVDVLGEILKDLGSVITWTGDSQLTIDNTNLHYAELDFEKLRKIRSSLMVVGPMLARFGKARFVEPGGCKLGNRPIDSHLNAFKALGAKVTINDELYEITADQLIGSQATIEEFSVTGTSTAAMISVLANGTSEWHLAAAEPENVNVLESLVRMGANISGIGTPTLTIQGVKQLHGATFEIISDRMEAATYAIAALATQGELVIEGYIKSHQEATTQVLAHMGAQLEFVSSTQLRVLPSSNLTAVNIRTRIYPGIATDIQAPLGVLATQCQGTSLLFETIYDNRLSYLSILKQMGAQIKLLDVHRAEITGPTKLHGVTATCPDIRAGAGLLIAALIADGTTTLEQAEKIDRGYTAIEERLQSLGAEIRRVED
jgi:UDP-N-acetylglucosamine 1-carboxyvinyltransferase